jgi:hypothetical protein
MFKKAPALLADLLKISAIQKASLASCHFVSQLE